MNIICIEDNPANMLMLERVTRSTGDTLVIFTDADHALQSEYLWDADLFLIDGYLATDGNEYDLASRLREHGIDAPVVMIAPPEVSESRPLHNGNGSNLHLLQPISAPELVEVLNDFRPY